MIGRLLATALWVASGAVILAALYWSFLNTPESNALALAASALLMLLLPVSAAVATSGAVLAAQGVAIRGSFGRAFRSIPYFIAAVVPVVFGCWLTLRGDGWIRSHSGEISAWFIATRGWSDVSWLFTAERWVSIWFRWLVLPVLGLTFIAAMVGDRGETSRWSTWRRLVMNWRTWLTATIVFIVLIVLPWQAAHWRPTKLAPTWIEPTLAGARLVAIAMAMAVGITAIIVLATRSAPRK